MCLACRCCHWGPLIALGIIKWVSLTSIFCNTMWWPPDESLAGMVNMTVFILLTGLTTYHFLNAMCIGPGYLEPKWRPSKPGEEEYLQYCEVCEGYKAPRTHHCRKCGRCVKKMDHHCPWINNCVGFGNHGHFIAFLAFAVIGCSHASVTLIMSLYYGLNRQWYYHYGTGTEPQVYLTLFSLLVILFALGLAIGVVLAVGALLFFQLRSAWRNQTGIEDWILEKATYRLKDSGKTFENPYNLGGWKNLLEVLTLSCTPDGDGVDWPLRPGSSKHDMTLEQLAQKRDKRERTREYRIVRPFSGSWCPIWSQGFRVACKPPCTDEARIPLQEGDTVRVTRWKKFWLYGDKVLADDQDGGAARVRGWFPRRCAVDIVDNTCDAKKHSKQSANGKESKKKK